jgi:hypothetical protein
MAALDWHQDYLLLAQQVKPLLERRHQVRQMKL